MHTEQRLIDRRSALTRGGLGLLAAPFLPLVRPSRARAAQRTRFIMLATPIGQMDDWLPTRVGGELALSPMCQPLAPFRNRLLFLRGLRSALTIDGWADGGHDEGFEACFTGAPGLNRPGRPKGPRARGLSIDQHVAKAWNGQTPFPSLQLGVHSARPISYAGENLPIPPQSNAATVYASLFQNAMGTKDDVMRTLARRASVVDRWKAELSALKARLGADQAAALDAHLTQIRVLEQRLAASSSASCDGVKAPTPGAAFYASSANVPAITAQMIALAVASLSCDLTRVVSIVWSTSGSRLRHPWATDSALDHHALTHAADVAGANREVAKISAFYVAQVRLLLQTLADLPEGGGSMLDNTVVFWGTEVGFHRSHSGYDMRLLIAGNAGGYFKGNEYIAFPGTLGTQRLMNGLLAELATGLGVPTARFGDPRAEAGGLPEIRARG